MDLTSVVERTKSMEQRLGISIQGVYAKYEHDHLTVNLELHVQSGGQLPEDIWVVAAAYDSAGRVIGTQEHPFMAENVFGFAVGSICFPVPNERISKIRVYPQKL